MKTLNLTKINLALVIAIAVLLVSCRANQANVDRAVGVFFIGVLQVINMIIFGIAGLIMCIVSSTSNKQIYKILGWIFFGIFSLFTVMGFMALTEIGPRHNEIYVIFMMEAAMMIISLIFVLKKPNPKQKQQAVDSNYLDKVINDKDEVI